MFRKGISNFCKYKKQLKKSILLVLTSLSMIFPLISCSKKQEQTYEDYTQNYITNEDFIKNFQSNVSISITDIESDTSTGTVKVVIPDLEAIYRNHRDEFLGNPTEEQIRDIISLNLHENEIEKTFNEALYKDGSEWKLTSTKQIDDLVVEMVDNYLKAVLADIQFSDIIINVNEENIGE